MASVTPSMKLNILLVNVHPKTHIRAATIPKPTLHQ